MRVPVTLAGLLAAAVTLAACGGGATATQQPTATATLVPGATPTEKPGGSTEGPGQSSGGGGGGGATLPDGSYTSGTLHLVLSGDYSGTYDLAMSPGVSLSQGGATSLQFTQDSPSFIVTIAIDPLSTTVALVSPDYVGGGGTTADSPCAPNFTRADATGIQGTIACQNAPVVPTGQVVVKHVNMQMQVTAAR